jgi:5-methylcytosine-specific restriction endonuclease McrA
MGRQKRWSSSKCSRAAVLEFRIQKGDVKHIRKALLKRDKGVCASCEQKVDRWEADHTLAVVNGGGGVSLDGYQTLCVDCHKKKTRGDLIIRDARKK